MCIHTHRDTECILSLYYDYQHVGYCKNKLLYTLVYISDVDTIGYMYIVMQWIRIIYELLCWVQVVYDVLVHYIYIYKYSV